MAFTMRQVETGAKIKANEMVSFITAPRTMHISPRTAIRPDSPGVAEVSHVRYAWDNNPEANLYNKERLAASPFTTLKEEAKGSGRRQSAKN